MLVNSECHPGIIYFLLGSTSQIQNYFVHFLSGQTDLFMFTDGLNHRNWKDIRS